MSDLVTRLRETHHHDTLLDEAADRIKQLENWIGLHRGDTLSLSNEIEQMRLEITALEGEIVELSPRQPAPTDAKINEAFKCATEV